MKSKIQNKSTKVSQINTNDTKKQLPVYKIRKPLFLKSITIDNINQIDKVNNDYDKFTFKIFEREALLECSKKGGYFDNKIVSFEKPFGSQTKRECIIISKYIHSKCLFVKSLSIILPELDTHMNQTIDIDDETIQKLFTSITEVATAGKLQQLEFNFRSWKKCTDISIQSIAECFNELFTKGINLTSLIINLNNWKEVTDNGAILLSQSLAQLKYKSTNLIQLNLQLEAWSQCSSESAEDIITSITDVIQKAEQIEIFKLSLWNWIKCSDRSCELISQLMIDLSNKNKRLQIIDFNFFGWTKCTDYGLEEICFGVVNLFQSLNGLLNFNLNISGWRGITQKGVDMISKTFKDCLFTLQPYLVDANITFSKSNKILSICSKYLRMRFMAVMQFLAFYKNVDWHINNPTQVSQDLYIDTLNMPTEVIEVIQQETKESKIQMKSNVKMPAYMKNQTIKSSDKTNTKKMRF